MSDETKTNGDNGDGWTMPQPVFRSSEGRKPGEIPLDPQADIPTEPGFVDYVEERPPEPKQAVRAKPTEPKEREERKKRGCAKTVGMIVGTVTAAAVAILMLLIYFLFFYRPADTSTF